MELPGASKVTVSLVFAVVPSSCLCESSGSLVPESNTASHSVIKSNSTVKRVVRSCRPLLMRWVEWQSRACLFGRAVPCWCVGLNGGRGRLVVVRSCRPLLMRWVEWQSRACL